MVGNKGVGEFVASDRHGQQVRYTIGKEGLFEDFTHRWPLARLLDQHVGNSAFQIVRVGVRDRWVISSQDFKNKTLHRVRIKSMSQSDHFIQDAPQRPYV